jgi:hypothetical protein
MVQQIKKKDNIDNQEYLISSGSSSPNYNDENESEISWINERKKHHSFTFMKEDEDHNKKYLLNEST